MEEKMGFKTDIIYDVKAFNRQLLEEKKYAWIVNYKKYLFNKFMRDLKCKKVLDVGFGTGLSLKAAPPGVEITGAEVNEIAVKQLKSEGYDVYLYASDSLPFENGSFDALLWCEVIEHLFPFDAKAMIQEFYRILKKDGKLLFTTPHPRSAWDHPYHIKPYTIVALREMLKEEGFKVISYYYLGYIKGVGVWSLIYPPLSYFFRRILGFLLPQTLVLIAQKEM